MPKSNKKKQISEARAERKPSRPSMANMVEFSLKVLDVRKGVPFATLKKHLVGTYMVDMDRSLPRLKKCIRNAVDKGDVVQTAGSGVNGRFKLAKINSKVSKPRTSPIVMSHNKGKNKKIEQDDKSSKRIKKIKESAKKTSTAVNEHKKKAKLEIKKKIKEAAKKTIAVNERKKKAKLEMKKEKETKKGRKEIVSAKLKKGSNKTKKTNVNKK